MALCPHCQNTVPEPVPAQCPSCGGILSVAAAPPAFAPALPARYGEIPWDARERIGFATALVETTRRVLTEPTAFFRAMPVSGGLASPLLYGVVVGWVGLVAAAFYQAVWGSIVGPGWMPFGAEPAELTELLGWLEGWAGFIAQVVFGGVFVVIGLFVAAGILHLMLLLLGGSRRGFEATFRVVSFSQASSLLLLVPFCGQLVGAVWCLVLYVIGLAEAHAIGHGKALAAVLLPVAFVCCCCAGLAFTFAGALAGLIGQIQ